MKKIIFVIMLLFIGCTQKEIVYIHPKLKTFETPKEMNLTAYYKNNKICIKQWDVCFRKNDFFALKNYIDKLKLNNKLYYEEIKKYNEEKKN